MKYHTAKRIVSVDETKVSFDAESEQDLNRIQDLLRKLKSIVRENNMADKQKLDASGSARRVATILGIVVAVAGITSAFLKFRSIVNVSTRMLKRFNTDYVEASSAGNGSIRSKMQMESGVSRQESRQKKNSSNVEEKAPSAVHEHVIGDSVAHEVAMVLEKIVTGVEKVNELIGTPSDENEGYVAGFEGINSTSAEENIVKHGKTADSKEIVSAGEELNMLEQELMDYVHELSKLVGGKCRERQDRADTKQTGNSGKEKQQNKVDNIQHTEDKSTNI